MAKKKVTAPVSYDPGKGRPKEYLAYLNYQEMEALKRLNGNNIERGPKGIPSYAAFAGTSGTGYSSGYKGTTTSKSSSSVSRISGGTAGSNAARAASSGSGFSNIGGGGRDSGQAAARQTTTSRFADSTKSGTTAPRSISGIGSPTDRSVKKAVENQSSTSANKTPALQEDRRKTVNAGPMGMPVQVKSPLGAKISSTVKNAAVKPATGIGSLKGPEATVLLSNQAAVPGFGTSWEDQQNSVKALADTMRALGTFDNPLTRNPNELVRHLAGELGPNAKNGYGQVAQTMVNRGLSNAFARDLNLPKYINSYDPRLKQWTSQGTPGYKSTTPGSAQEARIAEQALRELMAGVPAPYATSNRAVNQKGGKKTQKEGVVLGGNVFGNFEGVTGQNISDVQAFVNAARASEFGMPYENTAPMSNKDAFESYRYMSNPTQGAYDVRKSLPLDQVRRIVPMSDTVDEKPQKLIYDRLVNFTNPDGTKETTSVGKVYDSLISSGTPREEAVRVMKSLINAPGNDYNVEMGRKAPTRSLDVKKNIDPATTISRNPFEVSPPSAPENKAQGTKLPSWMSIPSPDSLKFVPDPENKFLKGAMELVPDSWKVSGAEQYAKDFGRDVPGYFSQGIKSLQDFLGQGTTTPAESDDVYGPTYVDPEVQDLMKDYEKRSNIAMKVPGFRTADALVKLLTGKSISGGDADLRRAYMQASDEQKAALEEAYPNLTKFASDAGLTPQRSMKDYYDWANRTGLRAPPSREGGKETSGIESIIDRPPSSEPTTPRPDTSSGRRPDIYYMWDLGIKIPSPGDPNYTQYQTYLAERLAAQ